jgi:hypothetical protein
MRFGRWGAVTVVTGLLIGLAPSTSSAITIPNGRYIDAGSYEAGVVCPFPIHIDFLTAAKARTGTNVTGPGSATVTNLSTNQSITYNASGPVTQNGIEGLNFLGAPASPEAGGFLIVTSGHVTLNPDGTVASLHGSVLHDVCAELA